MGKIFVSYRHVDSDFAHRLADDLQRIIDGTVFYDRKIDEPDWAKMLERQVIECNLFILCVTPRTFAKDLIFRESDWVRREIRWALQYAKPIIPVLQEGFLIPDHLPDDMHPIRNYQWLEFYRSFYEDGIERLVDRCVKAANGGLKRHSSTDTSNANTISAKADHDGIAISSRKTGNITINQKK